MERAERWRSSSGSWSGWATFANRWFWLATRWDRELCRRAPRRDGSETCSASSTSAPQLPPKRCTSVSPGSRTGSSKVRALLAFFTVLPANAPGGSSLEDAARSAYLLPLVGLLTGLPGAALLLLAFAMPPGVAATLAFGAVLLLAGLHHTDGVMDVGDALMVRGSPARRREVLKDDRTGAGAAGALFIVYAPPLAALVALADASPVAGALALLAGEVVARSAMLLLLVFGRPAEESSSSAYFARSLKGGRRRGLALALPALAALPLGLPALLLAGAAPAVTALFAFVVARRAFGGISGDVAGTTGELARAVLLIALAVQLAVANG